MIARANTSATRTFLGYTSFRDNFAWRTSDTYDVAVELDAVAAEQRLTLKRGGALELQTTGSIPYFGRGLTSAGWYVQLGSPDTTHRDVTPVGWQICGLEVLAVP